MDQRPPTKAAGIHVSTIPKMEAKEGAPVTSGMDVVRKVQLGLEAAGVELLNHGRPGIRLNDGAA